MKIGRCSTRTVQSLIAQNQDSLDLAKRDITDLIPSYPNCRHTILDSLDQETVDSLFGDRESILSTTEFDFDLELINTRTYRRALAKAQISHDSRTKRPHEIARCGSPKSRSNSQSGALSRIAEEDSQPVEDLIDLSWEPQAQTMSALPTFGHKHPDLEGLSLLSSMAPTELTEFNVVLPPDTPMTINPSTGVLSSHNNFMPSVTFLNSRSLESVVQEAGCALDEGGNKAKLDAREPELPQVSPGDTNAPNQDGQSTSGRRRSQGSPTTDSFEKRGGRRLLPSVRVKSTSTRREKNKSRVAATDTIQYSPDRASRIQPGPPRTPREKGPREPSTRRTRQPARDEAGQPPQDQVLRKGLSDFGSRPKSRRDRSLDKSHLESQDGSNSSPRSEALHLARETKISRIRDTPEASPDSFPRQRRSPKNTESGTDVNSELSTPGDEASFPPYVLPNDGTPINVRNYRHKLNKSQTSLLIEYFEGGKNGASGSNNDRKPSVRVRLTPSKREKDDHIHITETKGSRKASLTRRIPLKQTDFHEVRSIKEENANMMSWLASATEESNVSRDPFVASTDRRLRHRPRASPWMPSVNSAELIEAPTAAPWELLDASDSDEPHCEVAGRARPRSRRATSATTPVHIEDHTLEDVTNKTHRHAADRGEAATYLGEEDIGESARFRKRSDKGQLGCDPSEVSEQPQFGTTERSRNRMKIPTLLESVEDAIRMKIIPELRKLKAERRHQDGQM